jgi:hypothetical protein
MGFVLQALASLGDRESLLVSGGLLIPLVAGAASYLIWRDRIVRGFAESAMKTMGSLGAEQRDRLLRNEFDD